MNSSSTPGTGPDQTPINATPEANERASRQEVLQAEAIADVRRRVHEQEQRTAAEALLDAARRPRRTPWDLTPGPAPGFLMAMLGAELFLPILFLVLGLILTSVIWLITNLRMPIYVAIRALDVATGAHALPRVPWLMWTLWGAIFGGSLGYWLVAPLYGQRENRSYLLMIPLLAMVLLGGFAVGTGAVNNLEAG